MTALARLARSKSSAQQPRVIATTVDCLLQRVPPRARIAADTFSAAPGNVVEMDLLTQWLATNGFLRSSTVREPGEYAQRGGIVDLFAPSMPAPIRLDFFGNTLESIRAFDPETQRTTGQLRALDLVPMSELQLVSETMRRFRQAYTTRFGGETRGDALYETISEGRRHPGAEHWLPLFYDKLDTLFDYFGDAPLLLDPQVEDAAGERLAQIADYYEARKSAYDVDLARSNYKPLEPRELYLTAEEWRTRLGARAQARFSPFAPAEGENGRPRFFRAARTRLRAERNQPEINVFQAAPTTSRRWRRKARASSSRRGRRARASGLAMCSPSTGCPAAARHRPARRAGAWQKRHLAGRARHRAWLRDGKPRCYRRAGYSGRPAGAPAQEAQAHRESAGRDRRAVGGRSRRACRSRHRALRRPRIDHAAGAPHDCLEIHYAGGTSSIFPSKTSSF